jgi:hypothetical protein
MGKPGRGNRRSGRRSHRDMHAAGHSKPVGVVLARTDVRFDRVALVGVIVGFLKNRRVDVPDQK